jgi:ribonuclease HII
MTDNRLRITDNGQRIPETMPTLDWEQEAAEDVAYRHIAGLDEAGRGALAGPVVAAAVILPLDNPDLELILWGVDDSKQISAVRRAELFEIVRQTAVSYGIAAVDAAVIDAIGIIPATKQAMRGALSQLDPTPDYLLIDGRIRLSTIPTPQQSIIRGDSASLSIAAASILAKVSRDRLLVELDRQFPHYGFAQHKGYGTGQHRQALTDWGPCAEHRRSFAPLRPTVFGDR